MNATILIDTSDEEEETRTELNKKKWNDLKRYIPFLEYIKKLDPVKNAIFAKILSFLKNRDEYPARLSYLCETRIQKRYEKLKTTVAFPEHIANVFDKPGTIVISDEEEEIDLSTERKTSESKKPEKCPLTRALEEGEILSDNEGEKAKVRDAVECDDELFNAELFDRIDSLTEGDNNLRNRESPHIDAKKPVEVHSQNGPILRQQNLESELPRRKSPQPPLNTLLSSVSEDEELIDISQKNKKKKRKQNKRSDWFISEVESSSSKTVSIKQTVRRDSNKSTESHTKKPKKQKKKHKGKRKHARPLIVSDDEEDLNCAVSKTTEDLSMKNEVPLFNRRDPVGVPVIEPDKTAEAELFHRRDTLKNKSHGNNLKDTDTIILLDSDDERGVTDNPSNTSASAVTSTLLPVALKTDSSNDSSKTVPTSVLLKKAATLSPNKLGDLGNMCLQELNDVYSKLCQTTGIQLEEVLKDLVLKSETGFQEEMPLALDHSPSPEIVENNNNFICNKEDIQHFGFQQRQMFANEHQQQPLPQDQFEQDQFQQDQFQQGQLQQDQWFQQQQKHQQQQHQQHQQQQLHQHQQHQLQHQLQHQQQHQQQQQYQQQPPIQMQHTVSAMYPNTFTAGLNFKDPRILQKVKQIMNSPLHNVNVRDLATTLVNMLSSRPQNTISNIPEVVTSKTARTYGEHKRLVELEKQKQLENKKSIKSTQDDATNKLKSHLEKIQREHSSPSVTVDRTSKTRTKSKARSTNSSESESGGKTSTSPDQGKEQRKRSNSNGSESGNKSPASREMYIQNSTNCSESESGRSTPKKDKSCRKNSTTSESGRRTSKSSENPETKRKHSSESVNENKNERKEQNEGNTIMRKPRLRVEYSSSDDNVSENNSPLPKQNISRGCMTTVERNKVMGIVLSAIGKPKESPTKTLEILPKNSANTHDLSSHELSPQSIRKCNEVSLKPGKMKKKMRYSSFEESDKNTIRSAKTNSSHKKGCRELSNLNCTFKDYREMFEKNWIPTIDGKRRCITTAGSMAEEKLFSDSDKDDDALTKSHENFTAAPIKRRRQTCSALPKLTPPETKTVSPLKVVIRRLSEYGTFGIGAIDHQESHDFTDKNDRSPSSIDQRSLAPCKVILQKLSSNQINQHKSTESIVQINNSMLPNKAIKQKENKESTYFAPESTAHGGNAYQIQACSTINSYLVPSKSKPVDNPIKATTTKPLKCLNDDINMTLTKTKTCAICSKRPLDLTNHYVVQHKTESYISRLTLDEIRNLEKNITFATPYRKRYKVVCVFCQDELEDHFVKFHAHYSYHTGEYGYRCDGCDIIKPYREDIRSHQLRTSQCRNAKIPTNYLYSPDLTVIYLYVCKLCNFVQLNEANIHKHHRDHHGFRFDEPNHVKKCIIAAIDSAEVVNEVMPAISEEDNMKDLDSLTVNSADVQDQEYMHEIPLDIKDFLLSNESQTGIEIEANKDALLSIIKREPTQDNPSLSRCPSDFGILKNDKSLTTETVTTPELLLEQLHASQPPDVNIMTVIHCAHTHTSSKPVDTKPNVKELGVEPSTLFKSDSTAPELLLDKLYTNKPTAINSAETKSQESLQSSAEPLDIKPNVSEIAIGPSKHRKTNADNLFYGMFKCMVNDCWFSSNQKKSFEQHIEVNHAGNTNWRCSYCSWMNSSPKKLVCHVFARHSESPYQCSDCTYRSLIPANVGTHRSICHQDSTAEVGIYKCSYRNRPKREKLSSIQTKIENNLASLKCSDCSLTFYAICSMQLHMQTEHPLLFKNLNIQMFNQFVCIHCEKGSNSLHYMRIHMAIDHPDELDCVVERTLKSESCQDAAVNLKIVFVQEGNLVRVEDDPSIKIMREQCVTTDSTATTKSIERAVSPSVAPATHTISREEQELLDRVHPLLNILTESTGIYRSSLFQCSKCSASFFKYELWLSHINNLHNITAATSCPYCNKNMALDLLAEHMLGHSRHQYICLHCIKTFATKKEVQKHFNSNHRDCKEFTEKKLLFGLQSYYIVKKQDVSVADWVPVLQNFIEEAQQSWIDSLQQNMHSEWWGGLDTSVLEEIEFPRFIKNEYPGYKCLVRTCPFVAVLESDLDLHLGIHTVPRSYSCTICADNQITPTWNGIKNHTFKHLDELYVCCVCKYIHHSHFGLTEHIEKMHNSREVPVIQLWRDGINQKTSLSIVLPPEKTSFTTTMKCFCCEKNMKNSSVFLLHLRTQHNIRICPKCAYCDKVMLTQLEAEVHKKEHNGQAFKLKYVLYATSLYNLCVRSMAPFYIEVRPRQEKRGLDDVEEFSLKKVKLEEQSCIEVREEVFIKKECEYDVALEDAAITQTPVAIKCVDFGKLVSKDSVNTELRPQAPRISVKPTAELVQIPEIAQHQTHRAGPYYDALTPTSSNQPSTSQVFPSVVPHLEKLVLSIALPNNGGNALISTTVPYSCPSSTSAVPTIPQASKHPGINQSDALCAKQQALPLILPVEKHDETICSCPKLAEIIAICNHCGFEYPDFCQLRRHYDVVHSPKNVRFLFRIARQIQCMHCSYRGSLGAHLSHHTTFHPNKPRLCRSAVDPNRCGICYGIFGFSSSNVPKCACPMSQRKLSDCLDPLTFRALQNYGLKVYAFQCKLCKKIFTNSHECSSQTLHMYNRTDSTAIYYVQSIWFICYLCDKMELTLTPMLEHIRKAHITDKATSSNRIEFYKKIGAVYPRGLIMFISELPAFDEKQFKREIKQFEAQFPST